MDEQSVRMALTQAIDAGGGESIAAGDIGEVLIEDGSVIVVLRRDAIPHDALARLHRTVSDLLPGIAVELRPAGQVFRGGFGEGKHVIAVVGGKGGVGKSTISVNLALTLAAMGLRVGLLDGDLSAPDIPHLLGVRPAAQDMGEPSARRHLHGGVSWQIVRGRPLMPSQRVRPERAYDVEVMSVGFVVTERLPPTITGRVYVSALLRFLLFDVAWSADVLLIDAPPGTGEEIQIMAGELPLSGAIFVTTPQDLAQMDAERTFSYLRDHGVPVIGLVQNMAAMTCPHCEREIDMFAASSWLSDAGLPILGRIPFDIRLSVTADQGVPLVLGDPRGPVAYEFARIGAAVRRWFASPPPEHFE